MATKKKLVHNIESSKLPPPQRLGREAVRSFLRELDDLVGIHLTKIRDITPNYNTSREKTTTLLLTTVKTFLRTRRLPAGWHFADADTLPTRCNLDDVFIAGEVVKDRVAAEIAHDARVAAEAKQALYFDATATKTKLLVYADPSVLADMDKLRLHDYIEAARQKLGVKVLASSKS